MQTTKNLIITTGVLAVLLAITASSTLDWDLSHQLINRDSHFGEFFNRFGEMPSFLGLLFGVAILFGARNRRVGWRNGLSHLISLPFIALFAFTLVFMPFRYVYEFDESGIPGSIMTLIQILALLLFAVTMVMTYRIPSERFKRYRRQAALFIVFVIAEVLIVNITKVIWGRPRMRSLESIEQFHYWYQIAGPAAGEEFKSFPSGHTANGFTMIMFGALIPQDKRQWQIGFTTFALLWGICVALSRVLLGAHFLSDVIVGGYIAVVLFYLLRGWILRTPKSA